MAAPSSAAPPSARAAQGKKSQSLPLGMGQPAAGRGGSSGVVPAGGPAAAGAVVPAGGVTPPGTPSQPIVPATFLQPPCAGPGVVPNAVAAAGAIGAGGMGAGGMGAGGRYPTQRTSVYFRRPEGMKVSWYAPCAGGGATFTTAQLDMPARYNFLQGAIYRLKLSDIPFRPGVELYPTLEVVPATPKTEAFLAHSTVPVAFTEEDFEQVAAGNYVVKVIYLPDPQYQDLATTGPDEVVSTRLEPGVDPIAEAQRRGSILLVIRLGNINLEAPQTPAMDAPNPFQQCRPGMIPGAPAGMVVVDSQVTPVPAPPTAQAAPRVATAPAEFPVQLTAPPTSPVVPVTKLPEMVPGQPVPYMAPPARLPEQMPGQPVPYMAPPARLPEQMPGQPVPYMAPPARLPEQMPGQPMPYMAPVRQTSAPTIVPVQEAAPPAQKATGARPWWWPNKGPSKP
jgi:hypothetical protein